MIHSGAWAWHHTGVAVANIDEVLDLYCSVLGFEPVFEARGMTDLISQMTGIVGLSADLVQCRAPMSGQVLEFIQFANVPDDLDNRYPLRPGRAHTAFLTHDIEAAVDGVLVASLYLPNGNPQPGPKFAYKLAWFERLIAHAQGLLDAGVPAVLAGDYNAVPTDLDIYPTTSWSKDALLQPESRDAYRRLVDQGWTDALRTLHPGARLYTFWDYKRDRWARDAGLRLDHLLVSPDLAPRLRAAGVDREVRGQPGASDHAPAWIDLA